MTDQPDPGLQPQAQPEDPGSTSTAQHPELQFPPSDISRVWFITAGNSPVGIEAARRLLAHGDSVVAGVLPAEFDERSPRSREFRAFLDEVYGDEGDSERLRVVEFDIRSIGECQSAIADAVSVFDRIDVLFCCNSEALIGTVEELSQSIRAQSLVKDQFTTNFFGPVNIIKSALPCLRSQKSGHIVLLTGITGHLGTPGMGMYCASQWAIEGYCDSLAYEIAPFNIKISIVQNSLEIGVLTNRITAVPPLAAYEMPTNAAPFPRRTIAELLDRLDSRVLDDDNTNTNTDSIDVDKDNNTTNGPSTGANNGAKTSNPGSLLTGPHVASLYPPLPQSFQADLIAETVHAILAIGGHENPPARHIVGHEGVASVKEKLKTVSEELEDFVDVSVSVDL